ncbi:unnamed protein product [Microthlaspi erraticum]|uniref:F-box domain-containing protein n=1 Tax=Microthlaspi erraticum TaxID=1685480 RepID=A0A6D2KFU3_9BRAS|nr:unnamed protein product [Microthlaspi erraticum]
MALSKRSSSSLPIELVEEILCRIPIGSFVRYKWICKEWYALLNDKRSIYKLLDLSQKRFLQVDRTNNLFHLFNPETQALSCLQGPSNICTIIHCDGLFLCKCMARTRVFKINNKLAVWNPFLNQVKWIKPSTSYQKFDCFGFGYDNVSRDNYKILRLGFHDRSDIEIYEFKSRLWRSIDATLDSSLLLWYTLSSTFSMNGNMYWIANRKKDNSKTIVSFDFSRETFKDIGCGVPFDNAVLSGFERDRLSLLHYQRDVTIEVWVTNKVTDAVVSWSKYLNVTRPDLPILYTEYYNFPTYFIDHKTNSIMVWCGQSDGRRKYVNFAVYEMCACEIKEHVVPGRHKWNESHIYNHCYEYVPSLVPALE